MGDERCRGRRRPYLGALGPGRPEIDSAVEIAIAMGAGEVAVRLAERQDPGVLQWWIDRVIGAQQIAVNRDDLNRLVP